MIMTQSHFQDLLYSVDLLIFEGIKSNLSTLHYVKKTHTLCLFTGYYNKTYLSLVGRWGFLAMPVIIGILLPTQN